MVFVLACVPMCRLTLLCQPAHNNQSVTEVAFARQNKGKVSGRHSAPGLRPLCSEALFRERPISDICLATANAARSGRSSIPID